MGKLTPKSTPQLFAKMNIRDEGLADANLAFLQAARMSASQDLTASQAGSCQVQQNYTDVFRNVSKTMGMKNKALMKWIQDERNVEDIAESGPNGEGFSLENPGSAPRTNSIEFARGYVRPSGTWMKQTAKVLLSAGSKIM